MDNTLTDSQSIKIFLKKLHSFLEKNIYYTKKNATFFSKFLLILGQGFSAFFKKITR